MPPTRTYADEVSGDAQPTTLDSNALSSVGATHIVVGVKYTGAPTTNTMSDNKGTVFQALTRQSEPLGPTDAQLLWGPIGTPGPGHVVRLTVGASRSDKAMSIWLVTATGTLVLDQENGDVGAGTTDMSAGSITTSAASVSFVYGAANAALSFTNGGGLTLRAASDPGVLAEDRADASGTTFTANATIDNPFCDWAIVAAAFKEGTVGRVTKNRRHANGTLRVHLL